MNKINKVSKNDFVANIIEAFEEFLESKDVVLDNTEKDDPDNQANIYGTDYGDLQTEIETILDNYGIVFDEDHEAQASDANGNVYDEYGCYVAEDGIYRPVPNAGSDVVTLLLSKDLFVEAYKRYISKPAGEADPDSKDAQTSKCSEASQVASAIIEADKDGINKALSSLNSTLHIHKDFFQLSSESLNRIDDIIKGIITESDESSKN